MANKKSKVKYYYDNETLSYRKVKKRNSFFTRLFLKSKYRFVVLNEETFEEKFTSKMSLIKLFFYLILLFSFSTIIVILLIYKTGFRNYLREIPEITINYSLSISIMTIIVISIVLIYIIRIIYNYLKTIRLNENEEKVIKILGMISKDINSMKSNKMKKGEVFTSVNDLTNYIKNQVINSINKSNNKELNKSLLTENENINKKLILDFQYQNEIKNRFKTLVEISLKRANVNLLIGISITIIAFIGIGFTLLNFNSQTIGDNLLFDYFLPRFLTLAFVQVFAFFFLKNYRSNLLDIKYYQNEITNIELKYLGLFHSAFNENDTFSVAKELLRTEKNAALNMNSSETNDIKSSEIELLLKRILNQKK